MKTVGIIGGIGPESTIQYYRRILDAWRERVTDGSQPSLIINSINMKRLLDAFAAGELDQVTTYLASEVARLADAGAEFGLLAANTPHVVFGEIQACVKLPLISIVEVTAAAARERGCRRVGLIGTRFTMDGRFYPDAFVRHGMTIVAPDQAERAWIHEKYLGELVPGVFLPETRARLIEIIGAMKTRDRIDAVILGGTELPLILDDETASPVPYLDTTAIHVAAVISRLLD